MSRAGSVRRRRVRSTPCAGSSSSVPDNVPDDFWISTRVIASQRRLVYEPEAASYPFAGATVVRRPFERKVR